MIADECITELPFKDVAEIDHLGNNWISNSNIHSRLSINNYFLIEIDQYHNASLNGVDQTVHNYDTSTGFNKAMHNQDKISIIHTKICIMLVM